MRQNINTSVYHFCLSVNIYTYYMAEDGKIEVKVSSLHPNVLIMNLKYCYEDLFRQTTPFSITSYSVNTI